MAHSLVHGPVASLGHVQWLIMAKIPHSHPHFYPTNVTHLATLAVQRVVDLRPALDVL